MSDQITSRATFAYRCGANEGSASSNAAQVALLPPLSVEAAALYAAYRAGSEPTYILYIANNTGSVLTDIVVEDDLGSFALPGPLTVAPLTYVGPARLYIDGAFSAALSAVAGEGGISFSIPALPGRAKALLVYKAAVNERAPLAAGSVITSGIRVTAADLDEASADACTFAVEDYADLRAVKTIRPDPAVSGEPVEITTVFYNYGNAEAAGLVLNDAFAPELAEISVALDGVALGAASYRYENGALKMPVEGVDPALAIPAADFEQDPLTGRVAVTPGRLTVTVRGKVAPDRAE